LLDADADRADLELRLIKLLPEDRARVHPFALAVGRPAWKIWLKRFWHGNNRKQ